MVHTDLHRNPISPVHSVDIARKANAPSSVVITKSGQIRLSTDVMAGLDFAAFAYWKYIGDDGCNIISADEWERGTGEIYPISPPRPEIGAWHFYIRVPRAYSVGLIPGDYSNRIELSRHDGRGVLTIAHAIDKRRLHCVR